MIPLRSRITPVQCIALGIGALLGLLTSIRDLTAIPETNTAIRQERPHKQIYPTEIDEARKYNADEGIIKDEEPPTPKPRLQPYEFDIYSFGKEVNPHPYTYTIDPKGACQDKDLFLVAYVHTAADHLDRRNQIRKTWGKAAYYKDTKIAVLFMMGQPGTPEAQAAILKEADEFRDIVQESYIDAYHNLSIKAVGAMRWVSTRCKQAKFVLKTDDDVFINTFTLFKHLHDLDKNHVSNHRLLMCLVWYKMHVLREGKWAIPESVIKDEYYPRYCSGMGYIMSMDVVNAIYQTAAFVPFFWVDDVYITGMVPKVMNLTHVDISRLFMGRKEIEWLLTGQDWYKYIFSHLRDMAFYQNMWSKLASRAKGEPIPDISPVVAGKIATNYGPKKPPNGAENNPNAKRQRKQVIPKNH